MLFPFCLWLLLSMHDWFHFREKSIFLECVNGTFPNDWLKGERESDSVVKLQLYLLHLLYTLLPGDSWSNQE